MTDTLRELQRILWPPEEPNRSWDSGTIGDVADVLVEAGFGPPKMIDERDWVIDPARVHSHEGHHIQIVTFANQNLAITCETCQEIVADIDFEPTPPSGLDRCPAWHGQIDFQCVGRAGHPGPHHNGDTKWGTLEPPPRATQAGYPTSYKRGTPSFYAPVPNHMSGDLARRSRQLLPYWYMQRIADLDERLSIDAFSHIDTFVNDMPGDPSASWYLLRTAGLLTLARSKHGPEHLGLLLQYLDTLDSADTDLTIAAIRDVLTHALVHTILNTTGEDWRQDAERLGFPVTGPKAG
jgi:hypothetical protein